MSSAVIGINLGYSYSSIACIKQNGGADVIANEDGERQLATRIAFNGDQVYVGQQATPQLVRNAPNVVDSFIGLLGRSYSELSPADLERVSAPVIDVGGVPSFKVQVDGKDVTLSAHDVAVRFISALFSTAKDFLSGVPIEGAVIGVPLSLSDKQSAAISSAATEAGIKVIQLLPSPTSALIGYGLTVAGARGELPTPEGDDAVAYPAGQALDRTVAVVDVGATSTTTTLVAARAGLYVLLASASAAVGGRQIDDALVAFFAKEFTKKTKTTIGKDDKRAWSKLRIESEKTKKALSASAGAQQCSVESLAEGLDFSGSINRVRLDMLAAATYDGVVATVKDALSQAKLDAAQVDEVILVGGTSRLPGVADRLGYLFPEEGGARITSAIDSSEVVARGCAVQAQVATTTPAESAERAQLAKAGTTEQLRATTKPFGLVVPADKDNKLAVDGQLFVTLLAAHTPLPARRTYLLPGPAAGGSALLSFAEGTPDVHVETIAAPEPEDDDDEPEEPEEIRTARVKADGKRLAELSVDVAKGKNVWVQLVAAADGSVEIEAREEGAESGEKVVLPAA